MTKTKSQLRAEAVERLKKLNCMDVDCYQLLEATVDDAGEKVGYKVEINKLIDLLTPDAHESRGSYEERLHDVPVSDCPYCGCERVVIHDFSDIYENPHSYRVEHIDEKEAFETGCFETYYAFDSVEKAVEHANMRDTLNDEPMDARRDSDGTCPDADRTPSIEQGDDGVAKLDAQARAEIEDAERSRAVSGDAAAEVDSGTGGTEKTPQEPRECGRITFTDTREMLEADARKLQERIWNAGTNHEGISLSHIIALLDRQAAITERHWMEICGANANANVELKRQIDVLEANNAQLHTLVAELQAERDRYREKLGRAIDAAHEVVRMMEAE